MGKLDTVNLVVQIGKTIHDAVVAHRDEQGRRRDEKRKEADDAKDRRIKELEAEVARIKGRKR